jgi:3-hydroxy-3-methylglutaryl CoA synthase
MIGITSYGVYIPLWRLNRQAISGQLKGEKSVANFDEDSITMAVSASMNCLESIENLGNIDGLFFASTTSPYKEKLASSIIAAALDIDSNLWTVDLANSLRAGTTAMKLAFDSVKAGSNHNIIIIASDCRLGAPGSIFERDCGDGALAIEIGDKDVAVSIEYSYSTSNFFLDVWRADGDKFLRSWEERFIVEEGYLRIVNETVIAVMKKLNLAPKDFSKVVLYSPDKRRGLQLSKNLGFSPEQVEPLLFDAIGNTGVAYSLILLISALEKAIPGDRILLVGYGDGCDVFVLKVTENIEKLRNRKGVRWHLKSKKLVPDYKTYLQWRELLTLERFSRPITGPISVSAMWRDQKHALPLHGAKCKICGTIQYPPQIICTKCQSMGKFETIRLAEKKAKLVTFSLDYLSTGPEPPPIVAGVVDFEGGGRMLTMMTDREINEVKIGMELGMTFRKLFSYDGIHNYFWKSMPIRRSL